MFVTAECGAEICRGYNGQCARTGLHPIERPSLDASNTSLSPHAIFCLCVLSNFIYTTLQVLEPRGVHSTLLG
jgi:hypothetical protein